LKIYVEIREPKKQKKQNPAEEKRDNPYAEWVDTYKTEDFEGLANSLETLLDRYAETEKASFEALLPIYSKAMELELAFFGAQVIFDRFIYMLLPILHVY